MKENFKNFIKRARASKLSETEKDVLRSKILEFISWNPIRGKAPILRDRNYISIFEVRYFMKAASIALICVLVVGGSGVSYAAAKALPGEALYSVKININEGIEETLATTPKAKLAVQSEHIQRRLDEVQTLRKENKLSSSAQKIVIDKLDEHTQEASKSIEMLREQGDVSSILEATSSLTPIFEANKEILEKENTKKEIINDPEDTRDETKVLIAKIDDSSKVFQEQENSIIASVDTENTDTSVALMSTTTEILADTGPTEEEIATKKVASEVKAISRQISEIVQDRIGSAKDKLDDIKAEVRAEEAAKISAETKAREEAKKLEISLNAPTTISPTATTTPPNISVKVESTEKKSLVTMIEKTPSSTPPAIDEPIVETEIKIDTSEFDAIYAQIKIAEDILRQATNLLDDKNFKGALTLAQQANKIAEEIEAKRRLKALELSKKTNESTTLKASVGETIEAE